MKILAINYEYPPIGGGGATVCKELCELAAKENVVEVVTMRYRGLPQVETVNNVVIHRVNGWRSSPRVCHPWEQLTYDIEAYRYISKKIDMTDINVIHCHFIIPTGLLGMWLKKKYKKPLVITAHGSDVIGHNQERFNILYKLIKPKWIKILKSADAVTVPSDFLKREVQEAFSKCTPQVIPNGIRLKDYCPVDKKKSIITMCRLQKSKGVQDLLKICKDMDSLHEWEINILGDGPYRQELESYVQENGLTGEVHFRGHVTGKEKMQYIREAGIFFCGSRFEAFPVSVLEATAAGCYVIASDIEPHRNLVSEDHIYKNDKELRHILSAALVREPTPILYKNERFDWGCIYHQFWSIYEEVTGVRGVHG